MTELEQIQKLRADLMSRFPERREAIDGSLAAVLAGEHTLLVGPPGSGKSAMVRAIAQAFGGVYFERLLTKFATPEEIFGPVSLRALEQDRYQRVTTGKLPEAHFAVIDEVFKANSAILNSLLTAMNEKVFHNDGAPVEIPLISLFGASNELPDGKELEALFDRFLLRFDVQYLLRPSSFRGVLLAPDPTPSVSLSLTTLREAQAQVKGSQSRMRRCRRSSRSGTAARRRGSSPPTGGGRRRSRSSRRAPISLARRARHRRISSCSRTPSGASPGSTPRWRTS